MNSDLILLGVAVYVIGGLIFSIWDSSNYPEEEKPSLGEFVLVWIFWLPLAIVALFIQRGSRRK